MVKVLTSGATLQEAVENAQSHAVAAFTFNGEVLPFQQVSVDIATTAPINGEDVRFAGSVTFSVALDTFGVSVDAEGIPTVNLPGVDLDGLSVSGVALDGKEAKA